MLSVPTHYLYIQGHTNTVINLIFLDMSYTQVLSLYHIEPDLRQLSDYTPLIVDLLMTQKNIYVYRMVLKYNIEEESSFLLSMSKKFS